MKRGKYFRLIADVYIEGVNLGELLIKNIHVVKYDGGTRQSWCKLQASNKRHKFYCKYYLLTCFVVNYLIVLEEKLVITL
jgi:hypothetical protein